MKNTNEMQLVFDSRSSNESFARVTVAAFMTSLNPTIEEVADVKTAVSEAVTNCIVHGYRYKGGTIYITHQPCVICAKMIVNAGIKRIVVKEGYPDELAVEILEEAGLKVEKIGE